MIQNRFEKQNNLNKKSFSILHDSDCILDLLVYTNYILTIFGVVHDEWLWYFRRARNAAHFPSADL